MATKGRREISHLVDRRRREKKKRGRELFSIEPGGSGEKSREALCSAETGGRRAARAAKH